MTSHRIKGQPVVTSHRIKVPKTTELHFMRGQRSSLLLRDNDYQTGDSAFLVDDDNRRIYEGSRIITHVLKNWTGLEAGYVVLSFDDPEKERFRKRAESLATHAEHLRRSNASLRGRITKLRRQVGGPS